MIERKLIFWRASKTLKSASKAFESASKNAKISIKKNIIHKAGLYRY
jgi:hypothetical protein